MAALVSTMKSHAKGFIAALLILNLIDAVLTLFWVHAGLAKEANPMMELLVYSAPVTFMLAKLSLVGLGAALIWRLRHHRAASLGLFGSVLVYYSVFTLHVGAMSQVALHL